MKQKIPSFDTLLHIAQHDPDQLEQLRSQLASTTINSAPEPLRKRLRGLQFQIDATRKIARTPLAACIHISNMMHDSLGDLRSALNCQTETLPIADNDSTNFSAEILPFPGR